MPISEFRKKKLLFVFNTFFDVNESGGIDAGDVDLAVQKICESRGWAPGHEKYQKVKETLQKVWDGLKSGADENQDGQVSHDEWYSMWETYAKDPSQPLEWQQTYMNLMFDLVDSSGDGSIDEDEFSLVCSSHGVQEAESREAFKKLEVGQEVNREKFIALWKVFFSSDDPSAPGNFVFGKTSF
ncbi:calexcitin-2 [Venturia canescens]|uniref:calexcitin-2 n=1 Tax=Venturia canescens TaxID=32260 RepID=UPI001C9D2809|nr:calexcitin-2 [Venturia canescens]